MTTRVVIIGGYGNFGRFIATKLAKEKDITLVLAGRRPEKAKALAMSLESANHVEAAYLDITQSLQANLEVLNPDIVIHTSGPFQGQNYDVPQACIRLGVHYIDLADAREYVCGIDELDEAAKNANVLVTSGASSVPTLTSAIVDRYQNEFTQFDSIDYGIATAQKTGQGLATTQAVLTYAGKPFTTLKNGEMKKVFGWLGLRFRSFWGLKLRALGNCDIPDLALFPKRYPRVKNIRFQAGLEVTLQHLALVTLSWLVRFKTIKSLRPMAATLLKLSRWFDWLGKDDSGFFMEMRGVGQFHNALKITFEIHAREGDGLYIPCIPSIVMVKKLTRGEVAERGAMPCMGLVSLDEYLAEFDNLKVNWRTVEGI